MRMVTVILADPCQDTSIRSGLMMHTANGKRTVVVGMILSQDWAAPDVIEGSLFEPIIFFHRAPSADESVSYLTAGPGSTFVSENSPSFLLLSVMGSSPSNICLVDPASPLHTVLNKLQTSMPWQQDDDPDMVWCRLL